MFSMFGLLQKSSFSSFASLADLEVAQWGIAEKAPASPIFPIRLEIGLRESFHSSPTDYSLPLHGGH